jgi:hypothetical protein
MAKKGDTFTLKLNEKGDLDSIDLGGGKITRSTHNLHQKPPAGEYMGSIDLGKVYVYKQPDGTLRRCFHFRCRLF